MKFTVVGGGPSGLFFSKLIKRSHPDWKVTVHEQNPSDVTYGFGIGLLGSSLEFIRIYDAELLDEIMQSGRRGSKMAIVHKGKTVAIDAGDDSENIAIGRMTLLSILQRHCQELGIEILFESRIEDVEKLRENCDVLVGADGVNSIVRNTYPEAFGATVEPQNHSFAWYKTAKTFDAVYQIFNRTPFGTMIGHAYAYDDGQGAIVIECDKKTWDAVGFGEMSDDETRHTCEALFADYLDGEPLMSGNLTWFHPAIIRCETWHHQNVVLIGDALKTVHPSIGSGTRVGMRDAAVLSEAFDTHGADHRAAFGDFRQNRQLGADIFQRAAISSIKWYESFEDRAHLDPVTFAFSYMLRTGAVDYDRLRQMDPDFVRAYEAAPVHYGF